MGRIKSTQIKRAARRIFEEHPKRFSTDFEKNKKAVEGLLETSKKFRNAIAGYVTKLAAIKAKKK